jgi:hypothetical protein
MKLDILKWTATAILIIGFGFMSAGFTWGWYLQITGGVLWLTAAVIMKDKPLIATNLMMSIAGILGRLLG